jgi:NADPH-dependent 2,4-dienoyl-CoA reductase/sulfur reductase-like enzyme/rhodanese-related sulfurtransferase
MARTIVVIGGAGGGPVAAARARELDEHARIVLVEKKSRPAWVQAGLRQLLGGAGGTDGKARRVAELEQERETFFEGRHRIEVKASTEAVRIDPESHRIVLRSKTTGATDAIRYDAAIFSGGAEIIRPDIPGLEGPRVVGFRSADDLALIKQAIDGGAKRALVLGAGPYGVDAACGLRAVGLHVHLVERADRVLPSLSLLGARAAAKQLSAAGIELHLRDEVTSAKQRSNGVTVALKSGASLDVDLVVLATGLRPSTTLLSDAGASLNGDGSVRTNPDMQTTLPGVFACGTAVSVVHAVTRAPLWVPQAAIAARTAQIAGRNAAVGDSGGAKETLPPLAGSALYLVGDQRFARTGLSETEARTALGDDRVVVITIHGYAGEPWVGGDAICVRLVVDRQKNAVVGGELWGREGVPRRIDLLGAAVEAGWSPMRLADLDMAYAPTLGPAMDPLHQAGLFAALTLSGEARPISAEALALRVLKGGVQIVDVSREGRPSQWPAGTVQIPLESLRDRLGEIARDKPVVLVSQTGQRAWQAFRILRQRGVPDVQHLDGGWMSFALTLDR